MVLPKADLPTTKYFERIMTETNKLYEIADAARAEGKDLETFVEIKRAVNLAERTEAIIGPPGIAKRYLELMEKLGDRTKVIFKIFEEIVDRKLGDIPDDEKRVEQAIKSALVLLTEGTVVAPIDGIPEIKFGQNQDGTKYVDLCFAGPIRAAGATAAALPLILADRAQVMLGIGRYQPTESEIARYVEEAKLYEKISPRQFRRTDEDVIHIVKNCPVCMQAVGLKEEVAINRDLPRVKTNGIREGVQLVMADGLCLKAPKLKKYAAMLGLDWSWLDRFVKVKDTGTKKELLPVKKYIEGAAAGRPIFAYPSRFGAFRIRLGRTRTTGLMAKAIHPVTMYLLEEFPAVGSQLKVERPGKATAVSACDLLEPPTVLTKEGDVVKLHTMELLHEHKDNVAKILFLGDMLVNLGDFRKSGHPLVPVGFCEEWWHKILLKKAEENPELKKEIGKLDYRNVDSYLAVKLSVDYGLPLHPNYTFFYKQLTKENLAYIKEQLNKANRVIKDDKVVGLEIDYDEKLAKIFENIILPFKIRSSKIIIGKEAYPLMKTFCVDCSEDYFNNTDDVLKILSYGAGFEIKDKSGTFIGARLGRPEAAKPRKMRGSPQGLFPLSKLGGATRSINKAANANSQESKGLMGNNALSQIEVSMFKCNKCGTETPFSYCYDCNIRTQRLVFCRACGKSYFAEKTPTKCNACGSEQIVHSKKGFIDINKIFVDAISRLKVSPPDIVKGVEGLISDEKNAEPIEKGILRAKHKIYVFKDGTIRADMMDTTITHIKPYEINLNVEKARALGYTEDTYGKSLEKNDQILRMYPQDIIINEDVADYFVKVCQFVDELLVKFYNLPAFYNVEKREDLVGHLALGLAPHTSAAVVSRIIGFTKSRVIFSHPYNVCARRRNVDGDQDSIIMLLDGLLNFSKRYLSLNRGGLMDAPLVATLVVDPNEIDDEVHEMDINTEYGLDVYERAMTMSDTYFDGMKTVSQHLNTEKQYDQIFFTHDTKQFDEGPKQSRYTQIKDMTKKILLQIELQEKIQAVDKKAALEEVFNTHLLPDLMGNARSFARQNFRCTKCNTVYRRLPLTGCCTKCNNPNLILTIAEGSVKKYLEIAKHIVFNNDLSNYTQQRMRLLEKEINSIFNEDEDNQKSIMDFF